MRNLTLTLTAGMAALTLPAAANAATVIDVTTPTGPTESGTDIEYMFNSSGGAGTIDAIIDAFGSVDGINSRFPDTFTFLLNGTEFFSGSFQLGGSGDDAVFLAPVGSMVTATSNARHNGGMLEFSSPIDFVNGENTLTFQFAGTGSDELFGVNSLQVDAPVAGAVPEPETWAMMLLGFFFAGGAMRHRRNGKVAIA